MSDKTEASNFQSFMAELRLLAKKYGIDQVNLTTAVGEETVKMENGVDTFQAWPISETVLTVTKGQRAWKYVLTRVDGSPFDLRPEASP